MPLIWRHVTITPLNHIFFLAQGTQTLGALDIAQIAINPLHRIIHYIANVPLEIGEKNTRGFHSVFISLCRKTIVFPISSHCE